LVYEVEVDIAWNSSSPSIPDKQTNG
jgi:hypothetical protein